jgi:ferredoxin
MKPPANTDARHLLVLPQGWEVEVAAGSTLLEAAQQAGIRLARSCRNGTCRACLCELSVGEVSYRVPWPGLSVEERAAGLTLPCVALPLGDVVLYAPSATRLSAPTEPEPTGKL